MRFVDLWIWYHLYEMTARRKNDTRRLQLVEIYNSTIGQKDLDPEGAMITLREGLALAKRLDDPCMILFFDYWLLAVELNYLGDLTASEGHAVKLYLEARKPRYQNCPVLGRIYRSFITVYIELDPVGYADEIYETLDIMEKEIPLEFDVYCLLTGFKAGMAYVHEDYDGAMQYAEQYLAVSESSVWRMADACMKMAAYNYILCKDDQAALNFARTAEAYARRRERRLTIIEAQAWQGMLLSRLGEPEEAARLIRHAVNRMGQLGRPPSGAYFDALAYYHEQRGAPAQAHQLRDQELALLAGRGEVDGLCTVRLKRARFFGRVGMQAELAGELAAAHTAAEKLRKPGIYLGQLGRVAEGDYSEP